MWPIYLQNAAVAPGLIFRVIRKRENNYGFKFLMQSNIDKAGNDTNTHSLDFHRKVKYAHRKVK